MLAQKILQQRQQWASRLRRHHVHGIDQLEARAGNRPRKFFAGLGRSHLIEAASDQEFMKPWTLLKGGEKLMTLPKIAVMRSFVLNHIIHHRAQLGVYLRLLDVPVPSIYGPSADEGGF